MIERSKPLRYNTFMSRRGNKQLQLFGIQQIRAAFGGSLLTSNPKTARPLSTKEPIHLVLRSEKAKGKMSFLRKSKESRLLIEKTCEKYGIRIYRFANVGNHFHIVLRLYKRFLWKAFICELTSRLAALVGATESGFWEKRPFTRIVIGWGKNFKKAKDYVLLNELEAGGYVSRNEVPLKNNSA